MFERKHRSPVINVEILKGWEGGGPWAGADWTTIFGDSSRDELLAIKADLAFSLENMQVTSDETRYMREILEELGQPVDTGTVTQHLMMLKSSHLDWIIQRLNEIP